MKKMLFVVCVVSGILSCAGNADNQNQYQNKFNLAGFDSKRAAWKALGIDAYRFTGDSYASSLKTVPVTVTVLPGAEPEFTYDTEKVTQKHLWYISEGMPFPHFYGSTIDELFDSIRETALNWKDYIVTIQYNQKYHYPEIFYISMGDDKIGGQGYLKITDFEVLEGGE